MLNVHSVLLQHYVNSTPLLTCSTDQRLHSLLRKYTYRFTYSIGAKRERKQPSSVQASLPSLNLAPETEEEEQG